MASFFGAPHADLPTFAETTSSPLPLLADAPLQSAYRCVRLGARLFSLGLGLALSLGFAFGCLFVSVEWWLQIGRRWWWTYVYLVDRLQCQNTCVSLTLFHTPSCPIKCTHVRSGFDIYVWLFGLMDLDLRKATFSQVHWKCNKPRHYELLKYIFLLYF